MNSDMTEALTVAVDALADIRSGVGDPREVASLALDRMEPGEHNASPLIAFVADMSVDPPAFDGPKCAWHYAEHGITTVRLDMLGDISIEDAARLSYVMLQSIRDRLIGGER